ncbi:MAG: Nramp family divalent metal transporter [Planctomycetes bacterium]|nr:Nramp family divalent metal transporter [Planctomycetota bacterium]
MIVAGSIVGSGELIATTRVGAEAGFTLLWLVALGCVIKVFAQIEFGRHAIVHGRPTLAALDALPGPRWRVHWIVWGWIVMLLLSLAQIGGIVGGVAQALVITQPLTAQGEQRDALEKERVDLVVDRALHATRGDTLETEPGRALAARLETIEHALARTDEPIDARLWATIVAVPTALMLVFGRYGAIQALATLLVASFTVITGVTVVLLQNTDWAITGTELWAGLRLAVPSDGHGLSTALATFGIIGVGASELVMYPYWCIEKGYARFTGPRTTDPAWAMRARGWLRVLHLDAFVAMAVYTFATLAFYLLGAAVLGRSGLRPGGSDLVRTLSQMYVPVFGEWAQHVFLVGAFAVLYSTFFVATASLARITADALELLGITRHSETSRRRSVRLCCALFPLISLGAYALFRAPTRMILWSGVWQALMLPVLGFAALWFRHHENVPELRPSRAFDVCLWLSCVGFLIVGLFTAASELGFLT